MNWFIIAFKQYLTFDGRARRKEFWMFTLFYCIFQIVAGTLDYMLGLSHSSTISEIGSLGLISILCELVLLLPSIAVTFRRLHDVGKSGFVLLRFAIAYKVALALFDYFVYEAPSPRKSIADAGEVALGSFRTVALGLLIVGIVVWFIVILSKKGDHGDNKYGADPKAINLDDGMGTEVPD